MEYFQVKKIIDALKTPKDIFKVDIPSICESNQNRTIELISSQIDALLLFDISKYGLQIKRNKSQLRHNKTDIILRLDIYSKHKNPEFIKEKSPKELSSLMQKYSGAVFEKECSHLHFFVKGYNDKWAFPISEFGLKGKGELEDVAKEFCEFCNIKEIEFIKRSLF